jgi:hypothetical protein
MPNSNLNLHPFSTAPAPHSKSSSLLQLAPRTSLLRACIVIGLAIGGISAAACSENTEPALGHSSEALTEEQCSYFAVNDKVTICHRTASSKNPYVIIRTNYQSCGGHSLHEGDYVAVGDPTCNGQGCFPAGAPWDGSVECCEGLTPIDGVCTPPPPDPCQNDLTNIGQGDFRIEFTISTTQSGIVSVLSQRANCQGAGSPPGGWWSVRIVPEGGIGVLGVETAGGSYTAITGDTQINDGLTHSVVVERTSGVLTITTDGLPDGSGLSSSFFGDLGSAPLTTNDACTGLDGTQPLSGTLADVCVSHSE